MEQRIQSLEAELRQKQTPAPEKQAATPEKPTASSEKIAKKSNGSGSEEERQRRCTGGPTAGLVRQAVVKVQAARCFNEAI